MNDRLERDQRPSPEALLRQLGSASRGRFKIFVGAAPGVGKTYEMLLTAQAKRREGVDVVVGVVETHGRKETQALLDGLEIIPRRRVEHKGHLLDEMDIDAILDRRPHLVLVDELAHSNAPGSRPPKRYMDVEELEQALEGEPGAYAARVRLRREDDQRWARYEAPRRLRAKQG